MTYRILSLGTLFSWLFWQAVQRMASSGLIPEKFFESHVFLCNEAPWVAPWLLGSVIAAVIVMSVHKLTGWFAAAPLRGRRIMRAAVLVQTSATLLHLLMWSAIAWEIVSGVMTLGLFLLSTALALVGWLTFIVGTLRARFRRA